MSNASRKERVLGTSRSTLARKCSREEEEKEEEKERQGMGAGERRTSFDTLPSVSRRRKRVDPREDLSRGGQGCSTYFERLFLLHLCVTDFMVSIVDPLPPTPGIGKGLLCACCMEENPSVGSMTVWTTMPG